MFRKTQVNQDAGKKRAALAALAYVDHGMALGVGTGSTVDFFIDALAEHGHRKLRLVSSSERSTERLGRLGLDVTELSAVGDVDLYVDGADEATNRLHLIKGGGGALTREKIVAGAARKFVCIVDRSKLVGRLGAFPLPVEVIPMARSFVARQLVKAGGQPVWRKDFVTDNGNQIIDVRNLEIANPVEMETRLNQIPGVVTVGLFAHRGADVLLIGTDGGVEVMT